MALNIHVELNSLKFSIDDIEYTIRRQTDESLYSYSNVHPSIEKLIGCVKFYCQQLQMFIENIRSKVTTSETIDELEENYRIYAKVFDEYEEKRNESVEDVIENPFREDAWHLVHELDSNIFVKCRIILIRLRTAFLVLQQEINSTIKPLDSSVFSLFTIEKNSWITTNG